MKDLRNIALAGRVLSLAGDSIGIYPQKVTGGDKPYEKRTDWMEGWNACAMEHSENASAIHGWLEAQDSRLLEDLILEDRLEIHVDGKTVTTFVNCNDLFYWACSDCEEITLDELPRLKECLEINPKIGADLWCSRKRGMRPQKPYYDERYCPKDLWPLFDACGPEQGDRG